ncbi:unnamed protein product [Closterium sp. NIES-64]|nr:unnamed protein product [Closterium sp. NIES-64]
MLAALHWLSSDPANTIVIMSGSECAVLDEAFSEYDEWLAAENGMFMRHTRGEWMTTMPEHRLDSVQLVFEYFTERAPRSYIKERVTSLLVFEYFTERTPRSYVEERETSLGHAAARHVEERETSLVWNYKYADVKLGRMQPRDMLQHLWTGPISNTAVDVVQLDSLACFPAHPLPLTPLLSWSVASQWSRLKSMFCRLAFFPSLAANPSQGGKSVEVRLVGGGKLVEVRPLGVSKGAAMERGGKSVEVRPVGVSKGAAMEMVLGEIVHQKPLPCPFDFVITVGHLISRDEDIYQLFEPDLPHDNINNMPPSMDGYQQSMDGTMDPMDDSVTARSSRLKVESRVGGGGSDGDAAVGSEGRGAPAGAGASGVGGSSSGRSRGSGLGGFRWKGSKKSEKEICLFLLLAVAGQPAWHKRSLARYSLATTDDVVTMLKAISDSYGLRPVFRPA